ncbi:hypothetical protein IQA72_17300, partial [Leptospira borgpetersenii serovar Ballum]|uniref:hypothetical protein n=1 Tax=Leptospira borgpetersenii TaxID=174 RepID=UPI0019EA45D0
SLAAISGDNIINSTEDDTDVQIKGTSSGLADGTGVTVTIGGKEYVGTVANNAWSVTMPAADAQALPEDQAQAVVVTATDASGNKITAEGSVTHDATSNASISLAAITGDNIINSTEDDTDVQIKG